MTNPCRHLWDLIRCDLLRWTGDAGYYTVTELRETLAVMTASRSWRITKPLRALFDGLQRRAGRGGKSASPSCF